MSIRRTRDKDKTVQEVLNAAKTLFSEKGLHGTSIRDVENASEVSKGLILHHFGSKEILYAAVQDRLTQEYTAMMASQRQKSEDLKELIVNVIHRSFSYSKDNREFRRIFLWSYLEGNEKATELDKRFTTSLIEAMRAGQQANIIRDDIDAFLMPFIIKGAIEYWIQKENLARQLSASDQDMSQLDNSLVNTLARLFLK